MFAPVLVFSFEMARPTRLLVLLVSMSGCAGGERPEWLPPPANAVAQCRFVTAPAQPYLATRILHFDANGSPVRYDTIQGFEPMVRESWVYEYDEQGRLLRELQGESEQTWAYSGNDVVYTGSFNSVIHYKLDDQGRVITSQTEGRAPVHYEYDTQGRSARRFGATGRDGAPGERRWSYDERGRLTSVVDADARGEQTTTVTYVDNGNQTSLEVRDPQNVVKRGYTVTFDVEGRVGAWSSHDGQTTIEYAYEAGAIIRRMNGVTTTTLTGACPQPTLLLAPPPRRLTSPFFLLEKLYFFDDLG